MFRKLKKLKGRTLGEIKSRGRQTASVAAERFGISSRIKLLTDSELLARLRFSPTQRSNTDLLEYYRSNNSVFYESFIDPGATLDALYKLYPESCESAIAQADRICDGYFDLLGYKGLYFGGRIPNWHLDPVSRKESLQVHWSQIDEVSTEETGDKKVIWELNRQQYFSALGRAYWITKEEKYCETFVAHLESWFDNNPPTIGVNWMSSLEIAFRSMSWIWSLHFFKHSPNFSSELLLRMMKYQYAQARHIETYLSTYCSPNTHLTGEALGLYFIGACMPEFTEAKRWRELGYKTLINALEFQVRPDGTYCEQSSHYHRYTTDFYLNLLLVLRLEGSVIEAKHCEKLDKLLDFLMCITQPNGETPLFGDEDGGRLHFLDGSDINDFRPTLALGAVLLGRGDLKFAAGEVGPELLWLLGCEGLRKFKSMVATEPAALLWKFCDGGYFIARSGWGSDADQIIIQCGPHGFLNGAHAHADALSFVLSINGRPVFVDSGTYNYIADREERNRYRSSPAHNCLTVNGRSSSDPGGPFSWNTSTGGRLVEWKAENGEALFRGTHDGFRGLGVEYERMIRFDARGVVDIKETITSSYTNVFEVNFILAPGLGAVIHADSQGVSIPDSSTNEILVIRSKVSGASEAVGAWRTEEWSVSPCYGSEMVTRKLVFQIEAHGRLEIQFDFSKPPN